MLAKLTYLELKLFTREIVLPAIVLLLPLALLLGFGFQPGANKAQHDLGGQTTAEYMAALGVGIALAILGLTVLPATLASYREKGVLRRMATTPVRPAYLLIAQVLLYAVMAVVVVALMITAARVLFGTPVPERFPAFLAAVVLGLAALFGIGLVIAAVAPSAKAGNGIGMVLFFPSMFLGGVYIPREQMPDALRAIGDYTPLGATLKTMRDSWMGTEPRLAQLAIMAAYALVAGLAAAKLFRWE
ncbi:ABC transporter permease [Actinoallomurus sp. NPDC052308]|uniref:ABC transporter permease n=1 Tax=Actinoallomurus sp. NPDC052308 TaxID=3155530 RepID=UPI003412D59A